MNFRLRQALPANPFTFWPASAFMHALKPLLHPLILNRIFGAVLVLVLPTPLTIRVISV